jgi:hypothetical protein
MEMTRREFMHTIAGMASASCVSRDEGVSPLRVAGIPSTGSGQALPAMRGQDAFATEDKGGTPSPHGVGKYPGKIVPLGDISKQSKWNG